MFNTLPGNNHTVVCSGFGGAINGASDWASAHFSGYYLGGSNLSSIQIVTTGASGTFTGTIILETL